MSSGAMKLKVVDSEKTSKVFLTNLRQNVALEKELKDLEISEDTVVNRISSTQKVTYRRFQSKLQRSELMSARMRGDAERMAALRKETNKAGAKLNDDDEVNEVLKRIWRNGSGRMKKYPIFGADGRRVRSAVTIRTIEPAETEAQQKTYRPKTASARLGSKVGPTPRPVPQIQVDSPGQPRPIKKEHQPQFITTGIVENVASETEPPIIEKKRRPSTTLGVTRRSSHHSIMTSARSNASAADFLSNVDPFHKAQTDRLESHRKQLQSANYDKRITVFCKSLLPFTSDKDRFIEDYYYERLISAKPGLLCNNFVPSNSEAEVVPSDAELQRSIGNLRVRNLTMKRLNLDYSDLLKPQHRDTVDIQLSSDEESNM